MIINELNISLKTHTHTHTNLIQNLRDMVHHSLWKNSLNRVSFHTKLKPSKCWKMSQSRKDYSQGT